MERHQPSQQQPSQHQDRQPGIESAMMPSPRAEEQAYRSSGKLQSQVALITGGDSWIGRAVAMLYAREGADVAIVYLNEHDDAAATKRRVEAEGHRCVTFAGDVGLESFCCDVVQQTIAALGQLDILVNNAAEQHLQDSPRRLPRVMCFSPQMMPPTWRDKSCTPMGAKWSMGKGRRRLNHE